MKLYDRIKFLLGASSDYRNSDRKLIWRIWKDEFLTDANWNGEESITYEYFMKATSTESIRRMRQKIVEKHPELQSDKKILALKKIKESTKGNFVFQEKVEVIKKGLNIINQEILF